jgi:hypothetical protein
MFRPDPNTFRSTMANMNRLSSDILTDPRYRMPSGPEGDAGMAGLRALVVRFCDGDTHERRRPITEAVIDEVDDAPFADTPTRSLLTALGLPVDLEDDVALVAAAYLPHAPQSAESDAAADRLLAACGGRDERSAARVCVLVQAHAATTSWLRLLREGSDAPPVPATRRIGPDGVEVEVDLDRARFGAGVHRCPGEALAKRLISAATR